MYRTIGSEVGVGRGCDLLSRVVRVALVVYLSPVIVSVVAIGVFALGVGRLGRMMATVPPLPRPTLPPGLSRLRSSPGPPSCGIEPGDGGEPGCFADGSIG